MLKENDDAPDFSLPDSHGKKVSLGDYLGKWVVVYFYPKDLTPGCTTEAMDFTRLAPEYGKHNAAILGISKDSCESHLKFTEKKNLGITLLSDAEIKVSRLYGVWKKKKFMGREFMGTVRSTFLISPRGKISKIWTNVKATGHAEAVLEELKKAVG